MSARKTAKTKTAKTAAKPAKKSEPAETARKPAPATGGERKLSLVASAAAVLADSEEPLNCKRMIELAKERGLWTPLAGKTPEQTLYSAIVREIKDKGDASRFRKSPLRGHYLAANHS